MTLTPTRPTRMPLRPVNPNSPSSQNPGSTPLKGNSDSQYGRRRPPLPRASLPAQTQSSKDGIVQNPPRPRPSASTKRVSFGGDSINYYTVKEPRESPPPQKAPRTSLGASPHARPFRASSSPRFQQPSFSALNEGMDDDNTMEEVPQPPLTSSPYGKRLSLSTDNGRRPSMSRESMGFHDRASFGIFVDEDITLNRRDFRLSTADETTHTAIETLELQSEPQLTLGPIDNAAEEPAHAIPSVSSDSPCSSQGDITLNLSKGALADWLVDDDIENKSAEDPAPTNSDVEMKIATPMDSTNKSEDPILPEQQASPSESKKVENPTPAAPNEPPAPLFNAPASTDSEVSAQAVPPLSTSSNVQPVLPASRTLFSETTEELTLHNYPVNATTSANAVTNTAPAKESNVLSENALPSKIHTQQVTPAKNTERKTETSKDDVEPVAKQNAVTPTAEKIVSARKPPIMTPSRSSVLKGTPRSRNSERIAARETGPIAYLQEITNSALRAPRPLPTPTETIMDPALESFSFDAFLSALELESAFVSKVEKRRRAPSMAGSQMENEKFPRHSVEGLLYESGKKENMLAAIQAQILRYRNLCDSEEKKEVVLRMKIEKEHPPLYKKVAAGESLAFPELESCRVKVKALRKICFLNAKREWVLARQKWETGICSHMKARLEQLSKDESALQGSSNVINDILIDFEKQAEQLGLEELSRNVGSKQDNSDGTMKKRNRFIQELSLYRDSKEQLRSECKEEEDLSKQNAILTERSTELVSTLKSLRQFSSASDPRSARKMATERAELNSILSKVAGVEALQIDQHLIRLRLREMLEVQFSLHEERIINASCRSAEFEQISNHALWKNFVEGALSLINKHGEMKSAQYVRDIPSALFRSSSILLYAKNAFQEAGQYFQTYLGELQSALLEFRNGVPSLHIIAKAEFFSIRRRCKFDLLVDLVTSVLENDVNFVHQEIVIQDVTRYFGPVPGEDELLQLLRSQSRSVGGMVSMRQGLMSVFNSLQ